MYKLRVSIAAALFAASLVCTALALPIEQEQAKGRCGLAFLEKVWACDRMHRGGAKLACYNNASAFYNECLKRGGVPDIYKYPPRVVIQGMLDRAAAAEREKPSPTPTVKANR
jgi:hypothetical protein